MRTAVPVTDAGFGAEASLAEGSQFHQTFGYYPGCRARDRHSPGRSERNMSWRGDSNPGLADCKQSNRERCANRRNRRSPVSVRGKVICSRRRGSNRQARRGHSLDGKPDQPLSCRRSLHRPHRIEQRRDVVPCGRQEDAGADLPVRSAQSDAAERWRPARARRDTPP